MITNTCTMQIRSDLIKRAKGIKEITQIKADQFLTWVINFRKRRFLYTNFSLARIKGGVFRVLFILVFLNFRTFRLLLRFHEGLKRKRITTVFPCFRHFGFISLLLVGTSCMGTYYVPGTYDVPYSVVYIVYIQ